MFFIHHLAKKIEYDSIGFLFRMIFFNQLNVVLKLDMNLLKFVRSLLCGFRVKNN